MKTEFNTTRKCWQAMLLGAAVLGACGPVQEHPGEEELETAEQGALSGVALGIDTGTSYVTGEQPLSNFAEQAMCEFSNLGAKWVRIEADSSGVDATTYRRIVQKAHDKNLKVLVVVPARYCGADNQTEIDAFTTSYVAHLNDLATTVFTGTTAADGYEIGNEPNVTESLCPDGAPRFRVAPNAFAWLQRRAWQWKTTNSRTEVLVSGGLLNTYTTEPFWNSFFGSAAFSGFSGTRPFDYLGVHPYNSSKLDTNCINAGLTTCFTSWKNNVRDGLIAAANRVNTATGTTGSKVFATEFGFQVAAANSDCTGLDSCTLFMSQAANNTPYLQLAAAMNAAGEAFVNSAVTPIAIWYDYRDEATETFGLRSGWDVTTGKYTAKTAAWSKFRTLAGGTGSTLAEACWAKGDYFKADFENGDTLRSTSSGDWAYGYYKAECAPGERIMGVSKSIANGWSRVGLCYKDPLYAGRYTQPNPRFPACSVRIVLNGSDRGQALSPPKSPTTTVDWDPGNYLAECAPTEYVAGVAQSTDHKFSHLLCCPAAVSATSCSTVAFGSADHQESTDSGNWDAGGYKGECGVGRYVAGVSRTPNGQPNALLCCNQ
ncbi:hypothetical protein [Hyalangium versicolor]|uniref:hypothetical protein n=1 Tax=Hyalangium versicolor TaxID=2861190 RepID=UPI001CC96D4F|nr:hypothetical protein [Hyalangium versicolor]